MAPIKFPEILLRKYLDGTITGPESEALFEWLQQHSIEEDSTANALLEEVYGQSFTEPNALSAAASGRILDRLITATSAQQQTPVRSLTQRSWFQYAAAVLVLAIAGTIMIWLMTQRASRPGKQLLATEVAAGSNRAILKLPNGQQVILDSTQGSIVHTHGFTVQNDSGQLDYEGRADNAEHHILYTPRGGQYRLKLPDGTQVWLNAASSIVYPTAFTGKNREVRVSGEVYFEVAASTRQPFIVNISDKARVEVLGTRFNVSAYTDERSIRTTLLEGSVRAVRQQQAVILKPGQQAVIDAQQLRINPHPDVELVMAWREGLFRFDHASLDEVLRQMSRWYDVEVVYERGIPGVIFSGEIKRDLNLSQALIILGKMGVHYKIEGKKLLIMP